MNRKNPNRILSTGSLILFSAALPFPASADLFWDGTDLTLDADGGVGVWDTSTLNWDSAATAGTDSAWVNTQTAVFGGAGGAVSLGTNITAAGVKVSSNGYTLQNNALTLGSGAFNVDAGIEATVASTINSSLNKSGAGTLVLTGANSFSGATVISAGTLKVGAGSPAAFRYYRFSVITRNTPSPTETYNQIGELHYYKAGVWTAATGGTPGTTGETWWANANDNKGTAALFTKFGTTTYPYVLNYDFGTPQNFDAYNWSTGNDSTPARNPTRWQVLGSTDNVGFTLLDDRYNFVQPGPTATYTWAGTATPYVATDNSPNGGATNAYPIPLAGRTSMPTGSAVQIAAAGTLDLNGRSQTISSLADSAGGGGTVLSSVPTTTVTLEVGNTTTASTNFSGIISDGPGGPLTLVKAMHSAQTLSGTASNTYSGGTILGGQGKLVLAKTGGAIAIPGDVSIASHTFAGNASGIVLGANEQIVNTAIVSFPESSYGGGVMGDCYFRLNGYTETIRGLSATRATGIGAPGNFAVIENRGNGDTANTYGAGKIIINTPLGETYTFLGSMRNIDGGTLGTGGTVGIVKTGPGTQILGGQMSGASGPSEVNAGVLRVTNPITTPATTFSWNSPVLVTGTGTLEGNGSITAAITVNSGGVFVPGLLGAPFTNAGGTTVGTGGTLSFTGGSLAGAATIGSGGLVTGAGTITGALNAQAGSTVDVSGATIGTLTTGGAVTLAGTVKMSIDKTGGVITTDTISGFSSLTAGGTLELTFTGEAPALDESIQLFVPGTPGTITGTFTSVTGLPTLPEGTQWDISGLKSSGSIKVTNKANVPVFSPLPGSYQGAQAITLTGDPNAIIYYTVDGSDPTPVSASGTSPVTGITIPTDSVITVKAYATLSGYADSAIVSGTYRTATTPKWVVDAAGDWTTPANWFNEVVPNVSGITADFTLAQTAARTINLNANQTVGVLKFANANSFAWTLGGSSTLTLATPSGAPEINVQESGTGIDIDTSISALLAGTQGFTKTGPGTLGLTGLTKTYTGTITVNEGVLSVDALRYNGVASPLGMGDTIALNGGRFRFVSTASVRSDLTDKFNRNIILGAGNNVIDGAGTAAVFWFLDGVISGSGGYTKAGLRQLILAGNNTYDGATTINEGEVQLRHPNALGSAVGNTVVLNGARLAIGQNFGTGTVPENLSLTGMGGNAGGALQVGDAGVVPTFGGTVTIAGDTGIGGSVAFTISGAIDGTGNLFKVGANTITLSGTASNTYVGTTTLGTNGKLLLAKTGGAIAIPGNINLSSTAVTANATGIVLGGDEQIADSSVLTWTTTTYPTNVAQQDSYFRLNGRTETIGGLVSLGNGGKVAIENRGNGDTGTYGNSTLVINTTGVNSYSFNGNIRNIDGGVAGTGGTVAITKTGSGTQVFTGAGMSYTGPTTINGGSLQLNNTAGASPITVNTGGTLKGTGVTTATLTVATGGTVAPGASVGTYTAGTTVIDGTYVCEVDGATADRLTVNGDLDVAGAILDFDVLAAPTAESYIIASYTGTLTGSFEVIGLPTGYEVFHNSTLKQVLLRKVLGFAGYATANGLSGNANDDFDKDGLSDGIEYVLGTSPTSNSATNAPTSGVVGNNLVFTFNRADASMTPDVAVTVEASTLVEPVLWTTYTVGATTATSSPEITVTDNGATDTVTLTIPKSEIGTLFARLKVTVTPPTP